MFGPDTPPRDGPVREPSRADLLPSGPIFSPQEDGPAAAGSPPAADRGRVYVVDDERELATTLCEVLRENSFRAVGFDDPRTALAAIRPDAADLLLTDLMMPHMDGIRLARAALQIDRYLAVVVMTGQGSVRVAVEAMRSGAIDFILKPFRMTQLLPVLDRAVEARRVRVEHDRLTRDVARLEAEKRAFLEQMNAKLAALAATDPLTGLANRRVFDEALGREAALAGRGGRPLSLALFDVDHFKGFNDAFGHPAGDDALCRTAALIAGGCRGTDVAARIGGEEFAVLLPATGATGAWALAERVRQRVEAAAWPLRAITVSGGVATFDVPFRVEAGACLVRAADRALYAAKARGRNRIAYDPADGTSPTSDASTG
ncbi:diguanylate cyclase [Limnoglobus roseus]|uniref:diguanylate cyclase n=1 Tax=Limnoglobus roseus TaxID=2598579 RepID=A0A5C1AG72_9BACT|nr:diguanylate cyclase [Limnoglobus roseus]QEL16742.1 sensor domain-containing diguanylate cyclase [Limnoglobus roseus]